MLKYLASSVDNLRRKVLVLVANHLAERILNGWVVAVDKVAIDELHRQTRLACTVCQSDASRMLGNVHAAARVEEHSPTALLPTMATFLCLGAGMLLRAFWGGRVEADRLASGRVGLSQSAAETSLPGMRLLLAFSGRS
jgi:hypothetical protein